MVDPQDPTHIPWGQQDEIREGALDEVAAPRDIPTPLAEQIAREHPPQRLPNRGYVTCAACDTTLSLAGYAAHIATVTERAVRDRAKAQIEALPAESGATGEGAWSLGYTSGVSDAARIVEGGSDD